MKKLKLYLCLLGCLLLMSDTIVAQKAKFKSKRVTVQKTRLPLNYIEPEDRTYAFYKKGAYSTNVDVQQNRIFGWKRDASNPNLKGVVSIYGFSYGSPQRDSQKKTKKNKEGKVTESWTEYTYSATATGKGTLYIYGISNPFVYENKKKKKSKSEQKREESAKAKKKDLEDNPFLSSEDITEAEESDIGEDAGLDGEELSLVETVSVDVSKSVKTGKHRSASAALKEYRDKQLPKLQSFRDAYPNRAYRNAVSVLNKKYGYSPVNSRIWMKTMKSSKHDQYKKWNDACQATETLFKAFKYNKSIDDNQAKFDAIIKYFSGIVDDIPDNDRKQKKMKRAAFQNLTNILFYLDRHDAVITLCEKNLSSKILDKTAKNMVDKSARQKSLLMFHKMETCHTDSNVEIKADEIDVEEVADDYSEENK